MSVITKIFPNLEHSLSVFTENEINSLEKEIYQKDNKYYIKSNSKGEQEKLIFSDKKTSPEEIVRQLYLKRLITQYKYPKDQIDVEVYVNFGREKKRADIIVYRDDKITPYIIVETKAPNEENDEKQMESYLNAKGAQIGIVINGKIQGITYRLYPGDFSSLPEIPEYGQNPEEVFEKTFKYEDLKEPEHLKQIIKGLENLVLANAGYDSFEEIFKLIYAKIFDEVCGIDEPNYKLQFRARKDENLTYNIITELLEEAKKEWPDIFNASDKIKLKPSHLKKVVAHLQEYSLMGSNLEIIDSAFEYLVSKESKGEKGQYFTPRHVIDMCVKMLNPTKDEKVIDTACGSGGFLIHTMNYIKSINNFSKASIKRYASKHLWGIDFDEKVSKISKAMMLIAGDGKSHVFKENSLYSDSWDSKIKDALEPADLVADKTYKHFNFDILLANPPFAGDINEEKVLAQYPNVVKAKQKNISRHLLFIERNLNFVKDGGRLAIVLPQGVFNNTSEKYIRDFISDKARILAVVGLDSNTFKPHTGTKTSVIFLQKWDKEKCPKVSDYPIFFAVSEKSGKDNSGEYVFKEVDGEKVLQHDLFEIAEEFVRFAKGEGMGFWR